MTGFTFTLEHEDGSPAEPPTFSTAVPNWSPGDTIPLGNNRTLRVVEVGPGTCLPKPGGRDERGKGNDLSALAGSITVAGLTCTIPSNMAANVNSRFKVGDRAEIHCKLISSVNTLVRISKRR